MGRFRRTSTSEFGAFKESRVFIAMSAHVETVGCVSDQEVRRVLSSAAVEVRQSLTPKLGRCFAEAHAMERECDARVAAGVEELLHGCGPALRGGAKSLEQRGDLAGNVSLPLSNHPAGPVDQWQVAAQ